MAKHKGSGCEGQACLREEGEGSAVIGKKLKKIVAGPLSGILVSGMIADPYMKQDLDEEFDVFEVEEFHIENKNFPYFHVGGSDSGYSGSGGGGDDRILIKGRLKIAIGGFRPKELEDYPTVSDLIGKRIQKSVIKYLNGFERVKAEKLDEAIERSRYEKWEIEEDAERLYRIPELNALMEGSYNVNGLPWESDGDAEVTINSFRLYWGNGAFDPRMYRVTGPLCKLDGICISLAKKIVGVHTPTTHLPERVCVVVFVAFEFAISR